MSLGLHTGDVESRFHICFSQDEPQRELTGSLFLVYLEYAIGIFFLCVPSGARPIHTTEIWHIKHIHKVCSAEAKGSKFVGKVF
ncbi:hypothetical protein M2277_004140 [Paenibacillus sp. LBL]|nr:hypothetical protein [Paenibacillus sp. LBL]